MGDRDGVSDTVRGGSGLTVLSHKPATPATHLPLSDPQVVSGRKEGREELHKIKFINHIYIIIYVSGIIRTIL